MYLIREYREVMTTKSNSVIRWNKIALYGKQACAMTSKNHTHTHTVFITFSFKRGVRGAGKGVNSGLRVGGRRAGTRT